MADEWTRAMVADRLDLAADVMRSMPPVRPQGYVSAWPEYVSTFADQVEQEPRMTKPLPSPRMITQADEAMLWLRWVVVTSRKVVWLFFEHLRLEFVPVFHHLQGRFAA